LPTSPHQKYLDTLTATGGTTPYHWFLVKGSGTLPKGLKLNGSGIISGKAKKAGSYTFVVEATDSSLPKGVSTVTLTIVVS
jgi:hypothetical protein